MKIYQRRKFISNILGVGMVLTFPTFSRNVFAQKKTRLVPTSPPFWGGIGFNGSLGEKRFDLTRQLLSKNKVDINDPKELVKGANVNFLPLTKSIESMLSKYGDKLVQFRKENLEIGEGLVLGMATDLELAVAVKKIDLKNPNTKIGLMTTYISGTGLVMSFDEGVGWRVISSFSWMTRQEQRVDDYYKYKEFAIEKLMGNYLQHGKNFVDKLGVFKNWREGFSSNTFAQVISAKMGEKAAPKLKKYKLDELLTTQYLGLAASDSICETLSIPLIPFTATDATSRTYAAKFDSIKSKQSIVTPQIDLEFEIFIIDITKEVIESVQQGHPIIDRKLILGLRVFERVGNGPEDRKNVFQSFITDSIRDNISVIEDDVPERDFYFFDKIIQSTLRTFLTGISKKDTSIIASVLIGKTDALMPQLTRFDQLCEAVR
jgi:hypothetical protein